jgi:diaminopimelate decarboxylase
LNHLWPLSSALDQSGDLRIGDASVMRLVAEHGTPLYLYDELTLRERAREYRRELGRVYEGSSQVAYASKAYLCAALAGLFAAEGLDLDVVSAGELQVALAGGFPASRIHFHGNNKSADELREALAAGVGRVVVDNFRELALLDELAQALGRRADIWLRLAPGVRAHTHSHIQTGQEDTKFGFSIAHGQAGEAVALALRARGLRLLGLHAHIGSQIYEPESLAESAERLIAFAAAMRDRHGFEPAELSPGGGWGVPMVDGDAPAPVTPYLAALAAAVTSGCARHGLPLPHLVVEPGRSLVAQAGVAVYTVGARKDIAGVRAYVSIDGGMADNIRPALYGAEYAALRLPHVPDRSVETVTIAGKYCESGDVLIRDITLPRLEPGDLLAVPMAGAYTLAMASNYNQARRPAVLLARDGAARLIQRRESYADLLRRDVGYHSGGRRYTKYEALGNDYLVLDTRDWPEPPSPEAARQICDRHRGVGSDGALWGPVGRDPFRLGMFNPDGSEFEKSGNGLRIFAAHLWQQGFAGTRDFDILTPAGCVTAHILDESGERIAMDMGVASFDAAGLGLLTDKPELIEAEVEALGHGVTITAVNMGNPHCVVFKMGGQEFVFAAELSEWAATMGPALETLPLYPNRANVQFARVVDSHTVEIAIWERGVGYTLASGSSSCAAAAAAIRSGRCESPVTVRMPGGEMLVEIDNDWNVRLTGTARKACSGEWFPPAQG